MNSDYSFTETAEDFLSLAEIDPTHEDFRHEGGIDLRELSLSNLRAWTEVIA